MKSVKLTAVRELKIFDVPPPAPPGENEVLLRVGMVGICGSDIHYYTMGRIGSQVITFPFTVGHETAGTIAETGPGVNTLHPGQRVAVDPLVSCHTCFQCKAGRYNTCRNQKFLGCPGQMEGALAEYIVLPADCCYPLPDNVSLDAGVLCEPLAIGFYAALQAGGLKPEELIGRSVGILGSGPIGLSVMLACRHFGAGNIYMTDPLEYRCELARNNGAAWTGNPRQQDVIKIISRMEPRLLDVVFECCGEQEALTQALSLVGPGGKIMIVGIPESNTYSFQADTARRNEITLQNVRRQNNCTQLTIDGVASGAVDPLFMATHHFPLNDVQDAFALVEHYQDGVIKAMVNFLQ
jgi:L-iditol 2-dehydrogenase